MLKPEGYDNTPENTIGEYQKPSAGAVVFKILRAKDELSANNRPMLVLYLDIAKGEFVNHFKKLYDFLKDKNPDVKWPCIHRRCQNGDQISYLKGDIKAIEESNPGFKFNFDEKTLLGKLVGGMLGEREINAEGKTILEPRCLCSVERAESGKLTAPAKKKFEGYKNQQTQSVAEDDLPF
jgi:hypothetical protein